MAQFSFFNVNIDFGSFGDDLIRGTKGTDFLFGLRGNDTLLGGRGNDALSGGNGNDKLFGGLGNDRLYGGHGDDRIVGGKGDDVMFGGTGADKFVFNPNRAGEGDDRIGDFDLAEDKIVLKVADVLASTPGLLEGAGDPAAFEPEDLDASELWSLSAAEDGDLLVTHPNGTIEIDGVAYAEGLSFADIIGVIELIPVPDDGMSA